VIGHHRNLVIYRAGTAQDGIDRALLGRALFGVLAEIEALGLEAARGPPAHAGSQITGIR